MAAFVLPIIDGARNFNGMTPAEALAGARAVQMAGFTPPPYELVADDAPPALAYVNHNRLICDCPDGCGAAVFVWRDGPHLMICPQCLNGAIGYRWRPVRLPRQIAEIEATLLARPLPQNRNWRSGETVDGLRRENAENGV